MSYNLLYGAGADRFWDAALPMEFAGRNRVPDFLSVVRQINPHILGIQEANSWDKGTPPLVQQVAQELNMNSYLARTPSGFHVGLLTKFPILDAENLTAEIGRQGALRATLATPAGERLVVFVAHLEPNVAEIRSCEVSALIRLMQPDVDGRTILIGDMNFRPSSPEYAKLEQAGWKSIAVEPSWGIDQIWIYPSALWESSPRFQMPLVAPGISDHYPVAAELEIHSAINAARSTPAVLGAPAVPVTLPTFARDSLVASQILRYDDLEDPCALAKWNSRWKTEKLVKGVFEIEGEAPWQASAARYREFMPGQGILTRFQAAPGSEFEIYFENGGLAADSYRRFGLNVRDRSAQTIVWHSRTQRRGENFSDDVRLLTSTWYHLLLAASKTGEVVVQIWDPYDPTRLLKNRMRMTEDWVGQSWIFQIAANRGKVMIDDVMEISFDEIK